MLERYELVRVPCSKFEEVGHSLATTSLYLRTNDFIHPR